MITEENFWEYWNDKGKRKRLFEFIYDRYFENIYLYVLIQGRMDIHTSEDITQYVFMKFYENMENIRGKSWGEISSYLLTIAKNEFLQEKERGIKEGKPLGKSPEGENDSKLEDIAAPPEEPDMEKEIEALKEALPNTDLTEIEKTVFLMRLERLDYETIVLKLGITPGNARIINYRAMQKLIKYFAKVGEIESAKI